MDEFLNQAKQEQSNNEFLLSKRVYNNNSGYRPHHLGGFGLFGALFFVLTVLYLQIHFVDINDFIDTATSLVFAETQEKVVSHEFTKWTTESQEIEKEIGLPKLDKEQYDAKVLALANGDTSGKWPVLNLPDPSSQPILPFKRVVAYYGNLYSKQMGILGELPEDQMLAKLDTEVSKWELADPQTPVQPALHYIAMVAQAAPGKSGLYRAQMPDSEIDKVLEIAKKRDAIVFLDIQVGLSTIEKELPKFEKYLMLPQVHLGIDPEFSMKDGSKPGKKIGTYDAADINYVINYLSKLVADNNLPPKILVIHRFTQRMVTNYAQIKPTPEVQVVIHMDGWGPKEQKKGTYRHFIFPEPVQFTGFKLFYKNDTKTGTPLLSPEELLQLTPKPIYIQYQ